MLKIRTLFNYEFGRLTSGIAYFLFSVAVVLPLVGCGANGEGGPLNASLSTPTDSKKATSSNADVPSVKEGQTGQGNSEPSRPTDETAEQTSDLADASAEDVSQPFPAEEDPLPPPSEEDPTTPTSTGVTASLNWNPSSDPNVTGYYVYYGKQPSGELGSCAYEQSQAVEAPPAAITGLEPNTPYYFAISAFNEVESSCSIEIMMVTPSEKT